MSLPTLTGVSLIAGVLAFFLTVLIERRAAAAGLIAVPNHRSSHTRPTPSGGGVAIAIACVVAAAAALGASDGWLMLPVLVAVATAAVLGLIDDIHHLSPAVRLLVQAGVCAGLLLALPGLPPLELPFGPPVVGLLLVGVVTLGGLWWINLFNFIDGIDGLAASQSILILLGGAAIWWTRDAGAINESAFALAIVGAAATTGFLLRNWPPARIFMGDAGSNALAVLILAFAVISIGKYEVSYQVWLILPSILVTDATLTLVRRTARGERPWHAHRRHAYQQLSRRWGHGKVTLAYGAIGTFWSLPLAFLAEAIPGWAWPLVGTSYLPLLVLVWAAEGGARQEVQTQSI